MQQENSTTKSIQPGQAVLSIIIPAFNEEARIEKTLRAASDFAESGATFLAELGYCQKAAATETSSFPKIEIVVVDDGSTDNTASLVEQLSSELTAKVRLLRIPHKGKGAAVTAGMLASSGKWRMLCDADLAMSFEQIEQFFLAQKEQEADIVIGSRQALGAKRVGESIFRHAIGRMFNWWIQILVLPGIRDTQCGYKLFSQDSALQVFERVQVAGFAFDVEALFIARKVGYKIHELPVLWYAIEESKVHPWRDGLNMAWQCIRIRCTHMLRAFGVGSQSSNSTSLAHGTSRKTEKQSS